MVTHSLYNLLYADVTRYSRRGDADEDGDGDGKVGSGDTGMPLARNSIEFQKNSKGLPRPGTVRGSVGCLSMRTPAPVQ